MGSREKQRVKGHGDSKKSSRLYSMSLEKYFWVPIGGTWDGKAFCSCEEPHEQTIKARHMRHDQRIPGWFVWLSEHLGRNGR